MPYKLIADKDKCKLCPGWRHIPCFFTNMPGRFIDITDERYEQEGVVRAVEETIKACPFMAVELQTVADNSQDKILERLR